MTTSLKFIVVVGLLLGINALAVQVDRPTEDCAKLLSPGSCGSMFSEQYVQYVNSLGQDAQARAKVRTILDSAGLGHVLATTDNKLLALRVGKPLIRAFVATELESIRVNVELKLQGLGMTQVVQDMMVNLAEVKRLVESQARNRLSSEQEVYGGIDYDLLRPTHIGLRVGLRIRNYGPSGSGVNLMTVMKGLLNRDQHLLDYVMQHRPDANPEGVAMLIRDIRRFSSNVKPSHLLLIYDSIRRLEDIQQQSAVGGSRGCAVFL